MRMGSGRDRKRMNVEGDRLSSLPDDLIHKILSFMSIKHAIETSVLSSRWRYVWTSMPCLNFSTMDFFRLPKFSKFVTHVLSGRNNEVKVHSVKLSFRGKVSQVFFRRILDYAFSHNVQQLNITYLPEKMIEFPFSLISSQSLKNLTLTGFFEEHLITIPPTWKLPALATLSIHRVTLYNDSTDTFASLFSNCANLKNLTIKNCRMMGGLNGFNICHPGLSSLTLEGGDNGVNVDTPQLKNLTISNWRRINLISTPNLSSLHYKDDYYVSSDYLLKLSTNLLHLEKVDICINRLLRGNIDKLHTQKIVCLLEQLHIVKYLTLNLELVKLLSSSVELILHQPSPFVNLKTLKIYPANVNRPEVTMSPEVKNYLVDGSPGATLTMVSYKETRAVRNVASARKRMGDLQVLLDEWKENNEISTVPMESHMTTVHEHGGVENHRAQQHTKMKCHFEGRMTHIERYWEVLNEQLEKGYKNTRQTISMLRKIKGLLKNVPASDLAKLQTRFSSLRAEAEMIMDNVMDRVKIQCDKRPSR